MYYEKKDPAAGLEQIIVSYWLVDSQGDGTEHIQKVIPDGYPEIILHYESPYRMKISDDWALQSKYLLAGQLTNHVWLQNTGKSGMVGIKFQPTALSKLFGVRMDELTDRVTPLPEEILSLFLPLIDRLEVGNPAIFNTLDELFNKLVSKSSMTAGPSDIGVRQILENNGLVSIKQLTDLTGTGERQLERRFKKDVGLSPKFYSRIIRFAHIFDLIQQKDKQWLDLVFESGFYDQSHFIKNFKEFTGEEPSKYGFDKEDMANFHLTMKK